MGKGVTVNDGSTEQAAKPRFWAIPLPQARSKGRIWEEKILTDLSLLKTSSCLVSLDL